MLVYVFPCLRMCTFLLLFLVKIWKRKLEEEYKPYMLELEKQLTTEMLPMGFEEPQ